MFEWILDGMVYLGSLLMVYNIFGFVRFARYVRGLKIWKKVNTWVYVPIVLLVMFLLGYLAVGLIGRPDLIVAGILFGGSVFVFVIYKLLDSITHQIVESERLEAALMASEESSRAKSSFLASISHEMRTPMNVILGLNAMALKDPLLQPDTRTLLQKIDHSAHHLLGLINNMLDMQHIETGELVLREAPFRLDEVTSPLDTIARALCQEKGLEYEFSVTGSLEQGYLSDATQLKRALMCILENAVKYTEKPGTVRFLIDCDPASEETHTLRFTVSDTGVGIDPDFLPKIFDLFAQEDATATNRFGGSGMGLAIAHSIVEKLNGKIDVDSEKHRGSTFTVTVPLKTAPVEAAPEAPPGDLDSLAGCRVLIVDDIVENAEIVSDLLELEDAEHERAENGSEALGMILENPPGHFDAVLMDLRMPVMDGLEAARRIRRIPRPDIPNLPIIALSANAFESDARQSLDAGMNAHLVKPVDADQLYATLKHFIGLAQTARQER